MRKEIIILLSMVLLFGCDAYLDEAPDNRQTISTLDDVAELLVSAYSEATYNFVEWKTDNVVEIKDNVQLPWMTEVFSYVPAVSEEAQDTPTFFWNETYTAIAHSNQALEELSNIQTSDTQLKNALRGEALITRAYNHFMLANVFCLHYSEQNKNALGLPYITAPETQLKVAYDRGTLEATYNLIEKDLLEALPLLSDEFYTGTGKFHFNRNAAFAFASRFYLFKRNYEKCIEYSNKLLGAGVANTTFMRNIEEVYTGSFTEQANNFIDVNLPANLLVVRKESFYDRINRGYRANVNLFLGLFRTKVQAGGDNRLSGYTQGTDAAAPPKYNELFEFTTATSGFGYFIMPELRGEEVVLNRMESYVRLNRLDDALNDYNAIAPIWYDDGGQLTIDQIVAFFGGTNQEALLDFIIFERRKEFLYEGLRWFDIKRLELEIYHVIRSDSDGNVIEDVTLTENDSRKAVQIPASPLANGIEANPRN